MRKPFLLPRRAAVLLTIAAVVAAIAPASATPVAAPESRWTTQFGGTGSDVAYEVAADSSSVYVAGSTEASMGGTNAGGSDAFLRKVRSDGSTAWIRLFGSAAGDYAQGVAVHGPDVYVAGTAGGAFPGETAPGHKSAFVRRYSATGTLFWSHQFGTAEGENVYAVGAGATGAAIGGMTWGALPGQVDRGDIDAFVRWSSRDGSQTWVQQFGSDKTDIVTGVSIYDSAIYAVGETYDDSNQARVQEAFLAKFSQTGQLQWIRLFGSETPDLAGAVSASASSIYVAGQTWGALPEQTSLGMMDAFLRAYSPSGDVQWTRQLGSAANDAAVSVDTRVGSLYVAGYTEGAISRPSAGEQDVFIQRLTTTGAPVWRRQFGTTKDDVAMGVSAATTGVYLTGYTSGDLVRTARGVDAMVRRYVSYRPDGSISLRADGGFAGNDRYNADSTRQRRAADVARGTQKSFYVRVQNDGDTTDSFTIEGCASSARVRATYFDAATGGANVTADVVAGSFIFTAVRPSASRLLRVVLRVPDSVTVGTARRCDVRAASKVRPGIVDVVSGRVDVTP